MSEDKEKKSIQVENGQDKPISAANSGGEPVSVDQVQNVLSPGDQTNRTMVKGDIFENAPQIAPIQPELEPVLPNEQGVSDEEAETLIRKKSRRSFLWAAAAVGGTLFGINWLHTRRLDGGIPWPFRRSHELNESIYRELFSATRLAPEFSASLAVAPQENGQIGLVDVGDMLNWELRLIGLADMSAAVVKSAMTETNPSSEEADTTGDTSTGSTDAATSDTSSADDSASTSTSGADDSSADGADAPDGNPVMREPAVILTLQQLMAIPKKVMVTEFKCIEGWSYIVQWGGVPLIEVMKKYPPLTKSGDPANFANSFDLPDFVGMETNDGVYTVGLDMASAAHPQTLLCYEMNGKPLPADHGGPLRLVIPTKYNIKSIKQLGVIRFTNDRPKDYWADRGYDWYSGH